MSEDSEYHQSLWARIYLPHIPGIEQTDNQADFHKLVSWWQSLNGCVTALKKMEEKIRNNGVFNLTMFWVL